MEKLKKNLNEILNAAIDSVKPSELIRRTVMIEGNQLVIKNNKFPVDSYKNIYLLGAGKASAAMAYEFEKLLGPKISSGVVSTKYGHSLPCSRIKVIESGHPVLDENGLRAGKEMLELAERCGENDLVICLLSGGGSSLVESLPAEFSLPELQEVFRILLGCGANIEEMNIVRRHLSKIKGGILAEIIFPATCVSLILSDVINDPLEAISGGVTSPDPSTFEDAYNVLNKYNITKSIPERIHTYITNGIKGLIPETVKPGNIIFKNVTNIILGNNKEALKNARDRAVSLGYNTIIYSEDLQGEAREIGKLFASIAKEIHGDGNPVPAPACVLIGGETTVTIRGKGSGGRNQEVVLAALLEMKNHKFEYIIASCGTDGTDGPTDAAGAFVSDQIISKSENLKLDPAEYLSTNDSYNFFAKTGGLIITGPTGTNVMDIAVILIN
ncbi:MAG TPA: glycerate kinase [Melioribacteraceae bacterium]|nr:glycerate kinase [Melioribacteraceae bacterium]